MDRIEKTIEVHCPVRTVYNQWTQFEDFPQFMAGVKEVRQIDDTHMHWHAEVWGRDKEWDAEITEQVPDERISWKSTSGAPSSGTVRFEPLGPDVTRVRLVMAYEPEGPIESIGDAVGLLSARVQESVEDFKEFIEELGAETGGWRGEVHGGQAEKRTNVGTGDAWAGVKDAVNDSGSKLEASKQPAPGPGKQAREQWQLDQSIEESFPASDPISPAQPGNKPKPAKPKK
jgi:ribosome-associated toxin RatA of RatAB toxin-antitoxin module